jgi:hypothetical protein
MSEQAATAEAPVIFLDIDGVLNSARYHSERHHGLGRLGHFDPVAVERLNRLTDGTGAVLVLSSSWRQYGLDYMRDVLRQAGVKADVVGATPILDDGSVIMRPVPRGEEIAAYLAEHPAERFVILDDEGDMDGLGRHFVRTSHAIGLTDADIRMARWVLMRPDR